MLRFLPSIPCGTAREPPDCICLVGSVFGFVLCCPLPTIAVHGLVAEITTSAATAPDKTKAERKRQGRRNTIKLRMFLLIVFVLKQSKKTSKHNQAKHFVYVFLYVCHYVSCLTSPNQTKRNARRHQTQSGKDRSTERPSDRTIERPSDRTIDRAIDPFNGQSLTPSTQILLSSCLCTCTCTCAKQTFERCLMASLRCQACN